MTRCCGVVGGAVVDLLPPCKDMQSGGAICAGLMHESAGRNADVGREDVVLLSLVLHIPGKWGCKKAEGESSAPKVHGDVNGSVGEGVSSVNDDHVC